MHPRILRRVAWKIADLCVISLYYSGVLRSGCLPYSVRESIVGNDMEGSDGSGKGSGNATQDGAGVPPMPASALTVPLDSASCRLPALYWEGESIMHMSSTSPFHLLLHIVAARIEWTSY
jgi:hypothetical protein